MSRFMLWALLWVNGLGTLYGLQWYWYQITYTVQHEALWLVGFVPDSPTASLFFTLAIAYLLRDQYRQVNPVNLRERDSGVIRGIVEAFAVITSIKYGIWAVAMIIAGGLQGDALNWQHGMLIVSHLGMAIEAMLFVRFFIFRLYHIIIVAIWTLTNDIIDYAFDVFPGLPRELHSFIPTIKKVTIGLSLISITFAYIALRLRIKSK